MRHLRYAALFVAATAGAAWFGRLATAQQGEVPPPPPNGAQGPANGAQGPALDAAANGVEGVEIYNRGPIHEAYATPTTFDPVEPPVVPKQPPEPIQEVPPEDVPQGENVVWIPGYWAYDEELEDFLWVSGFWRDVPPDRVWVPGYWAEVEGGYRWVPGMWTSSEQEAVSYLPQPPPSQEQGPSTPSPGDDYFYVPGCWEWYETDYQWRPGYWAPIQENWIWVPAHYNATPVGYTFVPGYWDYPIANRGFLFAPAYFQPGFVGPYTPFVALNTWESLLLHLFVYPTYGHYVFGNWYGPRYANLGVVPWFDYHLGRGYSPLFSYYRWRYGPTYFRRLRGWHDYFVRHDDFRPRRTWREQWDFFRRHRDRDIGRFTTLAVDLDSLRRRGDLPVPLRRADRNFRERQRERADRLREFAERRRDVEMSGRGRAARPGELDIGRGDREGRRDRDERRRLELPRDVRDAFAGERDRERGLRRPPDRPDRLGDRGRERDGRERERGIDRGDRDRFPVPRTGDERGRDAGRERGRDAGRERGRETERGIDRDRGRGATERRRPDAIDRGRGERGRPPDRIPEARGGRERQEGRSIERRSARDIDQAPRRGSEREFQRTPDRRSIERTPERRPEPQFDRGPGRREAAPPQRFERGRREAPRQLQRGDSGRGRSEGQIQRIPQSGRQGVQRESQRSQRAPSAGPSRRGGGSEAGGGRSGGESRGRDGGGGDDRRGGRGRGRG